MHAGAHVGFDERQHFIEIFDLFIQMVLFEGIANGFAGDGEEGIQDTCAAIGHGLEIGNAPEVQTPVHDPHGHGIRQVPLVVLQNKGNLFDV